MKVDHEGNQLSSKIDEIVVSHDISLTEGCLVIHDDEFYLTEDEAGKLVTALQLGISLGFFNDSEEGEG